MEPVDPEVVVAALIRGQSGQDASSLSEKEKQRLAGCEKFPKTYNELFHSNTKWFKTELSSDTNFVNRVFDSGKGFMSHIGLTHSELKESYNNGTLPEEHVKIIDSIRKNLSEDPRPIVLTTDNKEFVVFDGGRRCLAFILENKQIPVYLGMRDNFSFFKS